MSEQKDWAWLLIYEACSNMRPVEPPKTVAASEACYDCHGDPMHGNAARPRNFGGKGAETRTKRTSAPSRAGTVTSNALDVTTFRRSLRSRPPRYTGSGGAGMGASEHQRRKAGPLL